MRSTATNRGPRRRGVRRRARKVVRRADTGPHCAPISHSLPDVCAVRQQILSDTGRRKSISVPWSKGRVHGEEHLNHLPVSASWRRSPAVAARALVVPWRAAGGLRWKRPACVPCAVPTSGKKPEGPWHHLSSRFPPPVRPLPDSRANRQRSAGQHPDIRCDRRRGRGEDVPTPDTRPPPPLPFRRTGIRSIRRRSCGTGSEPNRCAGWWPGACRPGW